MGRKIVCESCGTEFKFEVAKDFEKCPVCGALFDEEVEDEGSEHVDVAVNDKDQDGLMYFDQIMVSQEHKGVIAYCKGCKTLDFLDLDLFEKLVDKEYAVLKKDVTIKCRGCGKEHKPRKILYKRKDHYAPPLPRCPVCNSAMLKKIKTSSKFFAAAAIGAFALPYNSKTFECKDCGYRF